MQGWEERRDNIEENGMLFDEEVPAQPIRGQKAKTGNEYIIYFFDRFF